MTQHVDYVAQFLIAAAVGTFLLLGLVGGAIAMVDWPLEKCRRADAWSRPDPSAQFLGHPITSVWAIRGRMGRESLFNLGILPGGAKGDSALKT